MAQFFKHVELAQTGCQGRGLSRFGVCGVGSAISCKYGRDTPPSVPCRHRGAREPGARLGDSPAQFWVVVQQPPDKRVHLRGKVLRNRRRVLQMRIHNSVFIHSMKGRTPLEQMQERDP